MGTRGESRDCYPRKSTKLKVYQARRRNRQAGDWIRVAACGRVPSKANGIFDTDFTTSGTLIFVNPLTFESNLEGHGTGTAPNGGGVGGLATGGRNWLTLNCIGLSGTSGGTDFLNRKGDTICMIKLLISLNVYMNTATTGPSDQVLRILFLYDTGQNTNVVPEISSILQDNNTAKATTSTSFKAQSSNQFIFLRDFTMAQPCWTTTKVFQTDPCVTSYAIREEIDLRGLYTKFIANTKDWASIGSGRLYMVLHGEQANPSTKTVARGKTRLEFVSF